MVNNQKCLKRKIVAFYLKKEKLKVCFLNDVELDLRMLNFQNGKRLLVDGQGLQVETTHININQTNKQIIPCFFF